MARASHWTPEKETRLAQLWDEGHSCTTIAKMMGLASKSVVIGKARRLKLPSRLSPVSERRAAISSAPTETLPGAIPPPAPGSAPIEAPTIAAPVIVAVRLVSVTPRPAPPTIEAGRQAEANPMVPPPKPEHNIYGARQAPMAATVTHRTCRYPMWGDKQAPSHIYCDEATYVGAYCKEHAQLCYVPTKHQIAAAAAKEAQANG